VSGIAQLRMLTRYSEWANALLYRSLEGLPPAVLYGARPGRPNTLARMLSHAYAVDVIWQANLAGHDHGFTSRNLDEALTVPQLADRQAAADRWYIAYADELAGGELDEPVHFTFVGGGAGCMRRGDILLHVVNHKTYHRGYVADMLYESGLKPPTMDLPVFVRDVMPVSAD
jgi:uncharacterized damage-inducible protein DinB